MELNLFNQEIAEVKISYSHKVKPSQQVKVTSSKEIYNKILPLWNDLEYKESFMIILLSRSMKILGVTTTSIGGISGCVVDARLIFQSALKSNASAIILMHNHPAGRRVVDQRPVIVDHGRVQLHLLGYAHYAARRTGRRENDTHAGFAPGGIEDGCGRRGNALGRVEQRAVYVDCYKMDSHGNTGSLAA